LHLGVSCARPFSVVSTAFVVLGFVTSLFTIMWTVEYVKHFNTINEPTGSSNQ